VARIFARPPFENVLAACLDSIFLVRGSSVYTVRCGRAAGAAAGATGSPAWGLRPGLAAAAFGGSAGALLSAFSAAGAWAFWAPFEAYFFVLVLLRRPLKIQVSGCRSCARFWHLRCTRRTLARALLRVRAFGRGPLGRATGRPAKVRMPR